MKFSRGWRGRRLLLLLGALGTWAVTTFLIRFYVIPLLEDPDTPFPIATSWFLSAAFGLSLVMGSVLGVLVVTAVLLALYEWLQGEGSGDRWD